MTDLSQHLYGALDRSIDVLRAGLASTLATLSGEGVDVALPTVATDGANIVAGDERYTGNAPAWVEIQVDSDATVLGLAGSEARQRHVLRARCHIRQTQRRTTGAVAGTVETAGKLTVALWAHAVVQTLIRDLPGAGGIYNARPAGYRQLPRLGAGVHSIEVQVEIYQKTANLFQTT